MAKIVWRYTVVRPRSSTIVRLGGASTLGYCPRCGENSAFGTGDAPQQVSATTAYIRIPARSSILRLGELHEGSVIKYGGARFLVREEPGAYRLQLVE